MWDYCLVILCLSGLTEPRYEKVNKDQIFSREKLTFLSLE